MNCKTNKNTCTEFSELEVVFKIYNYCKFICLPTYSFAQFVFSIMVFCLSLSTEMSFLLIGTLNTVDCKILIKLWIIYKKNNYNKSVSIILFYFLIIKQKILQCLKYLPYRNKNLIKYWKLILYLGVLLDSASILTLNKMPKVFHLEF